MNERMEQLVELRIKAEREHAFYKGIIVGIVIMFATTLLIYLLA